MLWVPLIFLFRAFWISKLWLMDHRWVFAFFTTGVFVGSPDHLLASWLCSCLKIKEGEYLCFSMALQTQRDDRKKWRKNSPQLKYSGYHCGVGRDEQGFHFLYTFWEIVDDFKTVWCFWILSQCKNQFKKKKKENLFIKESLLINLARIDLCKL